MHPSLRSATVGTRVDRRPPWLVLLALTLSPPGCGDAEAPPASAATGSPAGGASALPSRAPRPSPGGDAGKPRLVGDRMAGVEFRPPSRATEQEPSPFRFTDVGPESGVDFVHVSGMTEEKHFPTANGSGAAVFDYDGDGRMDLYFASNEYILPDAPVVGRNRLYRNLGDGRFEDVTDASGLGFSGFCHGIVVGDADGDGDPDVVLCNYGPNAFYRNNGDGTFADATEEAGLGSPNWSSGGAFLDHDDDGDLDLYVANYGSWSYPEDDEFCGDREANLRFYCTPRQIRTVPHLFYRNDGDGTFTECAEAVGLGRASSHQGHGFGVVTADLNGDGRIDLYVANDMNANFLFLNDGDGTFTDATETSGAAYDDMGNDQSGMGVDAEDVDGDGLPELFVTNFAGEYNTLYQNLGRGFFYDQTPSFGLAADSVPWVGWGCGLVDLDNDGWPDAFVSNGHVDDNRADSEHAEPPMLHRNVPLGDSPGAGRRFQVSTRDVGPYFDASHVGRGVAFGDLDDDGALDIVVNHKDGPPAILLNRTPTAAQNGWIRLSLVGIRSNRDGIGAKVEVEAGGRVIHRQRKGGTSMFSAHDPRMIVGLGAAQEAESVVVRWPSGAVSELGRVPSGSTVEVREPGADPDP
ncbi:CRTAC1 family protein [Tautonia plasticadhaerens]|uniref:FG-GAP repeat protein n=1 Tax=Tautonia plasticadhaerens TaxID=2527974 RepID=A0A518H1X8_9BACT|nr:CRTAC1 family protein [Tautonia plasticadhaerens]QDV34820.1 FG-GAP repeat protein [Tautonia plasticadhaerens]